MSVTGDGHDPRDEPATEHERGAPATDGPGREVRGRDLRGRDVPRGDSRGADAHDADAQGADVQSGDADEHVLPRRPRTPLTQQLGRVTLVVLAVLFVVFAVANSQPVDFSWIVGGTEVVERADGEVVGGVPLILLLVAALLVGAAIGALVEWQFLRSRRERARDRR